MGKEVKLDVKIGAKDGFSATFGDFNNALEHCGAVVRGFKAEVDAAGRATGVTRIASSVQRFGASIAGVGHAGADALERLGSISGRLSFVLGGAGGGLVAMASSAATAADSVGQTATAIGVAASDLQRWRYAAGKSAVEADVMDDALSNLSERIVEAAGGSGEGAEALKALRLSFRKENGELKNSSVLMMELAGAFGSMEDGPAKTALAIQLLGDSGRLLLPMLSRGKKEIQSLGDEAEKMGMVFTGTEIAAGGDFRTAMLETRQAVQALGYTVGKELAPLMTPLIKDFNQWLQDNRALVGVKVSEWAEGFAERLPNLVEGLKSAAEEGSVMLSGLGEVIDNVGGAETVFKGFAAYMALGFVASLGTAVKALTGLGTALLGTPAGWVLAGVGLTGYMAATLPDEWEKVGGSDAISKDWEKMKEKFSALFGSGEKAELPPLTLPSASAPAAVTAPPSFPSAPSLLENINLGSAHNYDLRRLEEVHKSQVEITLQQGLDARLSGDAEGVTVKRDGMGYVSAMGAL